MIMNYFTKKRLLTLAVTLLIIMNVTSLLTVFVQRHVPPRLPAYKLPKDAREATTFFLKKELQFSDEQIKKYIQMQNKFLKENHQLKRQIGKIKKELFGSLIRNKSVNEDELISNIGKLNSLIERKTFEHFEEVKNLCNEQQKKKYRMLIGQILMRIDPDHNQRRGENQPPPHMRLNRMMEKNQQENMTPPPPRKRPLNNLK